MKGEQEGGYIIVKEGDANGGFSIKCNDSLTKKKWRSPAQAP